MPTAILNPNAPSPLDTGMWNITGAATAWEALSDNSASTFVFYVAPDDHVAVLFDSLPIDAFEIVSVDLHAAIGQEAGGTNLSAIGLWGEFSGQEWSSSFTPSDGSRSIVSCAFPVDPNGNPWDVGLVNTTSGAIVNASGGLATICEKMWLEVVYTVATVTTTKALTGNALIAAAVAGTIHATAVKVCGSAPVQSLR